MKQSTKPTNPANRAKKKSAKAAGAVARPAKKQVSNPPTLNSTPNSTQRSQRRPDSKLGIVIGMLRSTKGTTIEALSNATGWQTHSVRGAISGAIKKKHGLTVASEKIDGVRTYRISD